MIENKVARREFHPARRIRALYREDARPAEGRPADRNLDRQPFAEDREVYLEAGLDDYLAKPFARSDLAALFARWRRGADALGQTGRGAA